MCVLYIYLVFKCNFPSIIIKFIISCIWFKISAQKFIILCSDYNVCLRLYSISSKSEPLLRTRTEPPNCDWPRVIWLCVLWLADSYRRVPKLTLSPMSGLWWGCAEKTCFGRPDGSLLDGTEYRTHWFAHRKFV